MRTVSIRSVFIQHSPLRPPKVTTVTLCPGERVVSVESVQPNPSIGSGTRIWIECS